LYDCAHLLLRLPLPPGSTGQLLPYTTLFRSDQRADRAPPQPDHRRGGHLRMRLLASLAAAFLLRLGGPHPPYGAEVADGEAAALAEVERTAQRAGAVEVVDADPAARLGAAGDEPGDRAEPDDGEEVPRGHRRRQERQPGARGRADRGDHPHARRRGEPVHRVPPDEDEAGADEAD